MTRSLCGTIPLDERREFNEKATGLECTRGWEVSILRP